MGKSYKWFMLVLLSLAFFFSPARTRSPSRSDGKTASRKLRSLSPTASIEFIRLESLS